MSRSAPEADRGCFRRALALRLSAPASDHGPLVLPVAGGAAGLLGASVCRRLVSLLDPATVDPGRGGLRSWLERRQARRSALLLVPDRATGIRFAGRWSLDLARVRAVPDLQSPPRGLVERCLAESAARGRRPRSWHDV
jgi:hypothetical protein